MEETMVIMEKYYSEYDSPIISYVCGECGEKFLDRDDNYKFCPHCGRKIGWIVEDSRLHLGDGENG